MPGAESGPPASGSGAPAPDQPAAEAAAGAAETDAHAGEPVDLRKPTKSRVLLEVHIPKYWILGIITAIVVVLLIGVLGFSTLNSITLCDTCHVIRPEVATYKHSAHYRAGVKCQKCHTPPGVFNYFIRNLQGLTNVILFVSNKYERPITTYVGADNCTQCHPNSQIERDLVVGNIRVNHTGLRQAGYQCLTCHANISHPGTRPAVARTAQNPMSICARCHDGVRLPNTCSTCHIDHVPMVGSKVAITVKLTPQQCVGCHARPKFCSDCHSGLQMPHPRRWNKIHGPLVVKRGKKICIECHLAKNPNFCIDCHKLPMPHPASWRTAHAPVGQKDPAVCVQCHGQNSCFRCHGLQMPHPASWLSVHGQRALADPALCNKCHTSQFCFNCHGLQMPHPSGWLSTHPQTALSNPAVCNRCHSSQFCFNCHGVSLPHSSSFIASHPKQVYSIGGVVCQKCHGNRGNAPQGCYGGQCHKGHVSAGGPNSRP